MISSYCERIRRHYLECWQGEVAAVDFRKGPVSDLPSQFRILLISPSQKRRMWTYATQCMSQPEDTECLELHMFSAGRHDEIAELLVATAHYHRTGSKLGLGHTVNFGRPWLPNSHCDRGLISLPYMDGPTLEWLKDDVAKTRFLWLIPITKREVEFARKNGLEALESQFEKSKFNYLDPERTSVV
jgi:Suppressor of fused protein (SUFU)